MDRVTGGPFAGSVHAGKDEDIAQFHLWVGDAIEQRCLAMLGAEVLPLFPDGSFSGASESCDGLT